MPLGGLWSGGVLFGPPAGALGVDPSPLPRGARRAAAHTVHADPGIASSPAQGLVQSGEEEAVGELSACERDILRLVADGYTNKEIAELVDLSALTVESHLARIARTLGTGDRAHMVALGIRPRVIH